MKIRKIVTLWTLDFGRVIGLSGTCYGRFAISFPIVQCMLLFV